MKALTAWLLLMTLPAIPLYGQDLSSGDVRVSLDAALPIAQQVAANAVPDLADYVLYSITPRVLKGDPGGLHWQVRWQERAFPHHRWTVVRVYMKDGHTTVARSVEKQLPSASPAEGAH